MHTVYNLYQGKVYADTPFHINDELAIFSDPSVAIGQFTNCPIDEYNAMPKSATEAVDRQISIVDNKILDLEGERSELNNLWTELVSEEASKSKIKPEVMKQMNTRKINEPARIMKLT